MSELDVAAIKKLKVAELKAELSKRGLPVKGKKDELVKRLVEAIEQDSEGGAEIVTEQEIPEGNVLDESTADEEGISQTDNTQTDKNGYEEPQQNEVVQQEAEETASHKAVGEADVMAVIAEESAEETKTDDVVNQDDWVMVEPPTEQEQVEADEVASLHPVEPAKTGMSEETTMVEDVEMKELPSDVPLSFAAEQSTPQETKIEGSTIQSKDEDQTSEKKEEKHDEAPTPIDTLVDVEYEEGEASEIIPISEGHVGLDGYTCDINFVVTNNGLKGCNLIKNGFKYLWAGARANKGAKSGKIGYELKVVKCLKVELNEKEAPIHGVRVGWSVETSSLQLGEEEAFSYGYESDGKVCAASTFFAYGDSFGEGDVIGTYFDLESETKTLRYTKNGVDLGVAVSLNLKLDEKSLFPHIFIRNMEVELNFGGRDEPWFDILKGYSLIQNAGAENIADSSYEPPSSKEECEVLMMVGLPNSGKTTWVKKYVESHLEKRYCVIGLSEILERCRLEGKKRTKNDSGYEDLMKSLIQVLTKLYELCPKKNRNFIYDQNNVYKIAQSTKIEPFAGFKRKAIVVVPTHDNLRKRTSDAKRKGDHIHDLPFADLCDMKCEFHLPEVGDLFDEIVFPELDEKNASKTIRDYQSDGSRAKKTGRDEYYPRKRQRNDDRRRDRYSGGRDRQDSRYGGSGGGGYKGRDNYVSGGNRSGYQDPYRRHGSGNYGGGGYRQNQGGYGGGGYRNNSSGGYGGGYGGSYGNGYGSGSQGYGSNYNYNQQQSGNRGNSGQWGGGQYGNNYNQGQSHGQWGSNQGSWGGYNYSNYNQSGGGYGGSGYSY